MIRPVMEPLPRAAALIVNVKSRRGRRMFRDACRLLRGAGIELVRTNAVRDPTKLAGAVKAAVTAGAPMVIVGGGDGSLSCSVDHLVDTDTVLALLPLGTANSFARTLCVPLDVAGAVRVIDRGRAKWIDLAMIDDNYFANCAAIGISPLVAETVPHGLKKWLGRPGYLAWAALQMMRYRPFTLTIAGDGVAETIEVLEVRIANGGYHGGTEIVDATVDSGVIVIQAVMGTRRAMLLWSWGLSLIGRDRARATLREYRGTRFRITTTPALPISIDGEVLAKTPVTARVAARAIRMAVPA